MTETMWGALISAGVSLAVAIIGGAYLVRAKRTPAAPEAVPVTELWKENRLRGEELEQAHAEVRLVRAGFDVLLGWMRRAILSWGVEPRPPALTQREVEVLEKAGAHLTFDGDGDGPA